MSNRRRHQILKKRSTVVGYWLIQTLLVLVAAILFAESLGGVGESLIAAIFGLILSGTIAAAQALLVCDPDTLGGAREVGPVRRWTSYLTFGGCATVLGASPMWIGLAILLTDRDENLIRFVAWIGCAAMIGMMAWWTGWMRGIARAGRRERRYRDAARSLAVGSVLSLVASIVLAFIASVAWSDADAFAITATLASIPVVAIGLVAIGCLLYLKELAAVREAWYLSHCAECGYDLSGNLDASKCSECGTPWTHAAIVPTGSRRAAGKCDNCGYDMSGTPNADKCPECGTGWRIAPSDRPEGRVTP